MSMQPEANGGGGRRTRSDAGGGATTVTSVLESASLLIAYLIPLVQFVLSNFTIESSTCSTSTR
ncbi:hypothetical protein FA95DRAFT_1614354 [Auriscalpium vulgare]|uniref:Uncharacterized protein n=1 Tax=Auriscalpium vulgare TaxID=40419 RepID=A0ACB8R0I7_9AGAM|nr:hypothetical protein FA95DRAFT_1614354 [Auriscalpium vulgare]